MKTMKKRAICFGALALVGAVLLSASGCASGEKVYAQMAASSSAAAGSAQTTGLHNPHQTTFRPLVWQAQDTSQDAHSDGSVSHVVLQKNSSSPKLSVTLPWQIYEVCSKLKDCTLTYRTPQTKTENAPSLQLFYNETERYTWSQHLFTFQSASASGGLIDSQGHETWPLGVYDSPQADKVIAEEYDAFSKQPDASAYAPKQITFGELLSRSDWKVEQVILQKGQHGGSYKEGEDNGMRTLTKAADIETFLKKLEGCTLTRANDSALTSEMYSVDLKVNGGFFSWEDNACTTHLGLKLQEGLPVGDYVSVYRRRKWLTSTVPELGGFAGRFGAPLFFTSHIEHKSRVTMKYLVAMQKDLHRIEKKFLYLAEKHGMIGLFVKKILRFG